jgi:hypothetical protein
MQNDKENLIASIDELQQNVCKLTYNLALDWCVRKAVRQNSDSDFKQFLYATDSHEHIFATYQNAIYDSIIICFGKIFDEESKSKYSLKAIKSNFGKEIKKPTELQQFDVNSYREIITTFNNSKAIQYYEEHFKNIRNKFIAHAEISRDEYNNLISQAKIKDLESMCDSLLILCRELFKLLGIEKNGYTNFNGVLNNVKSHLDTIGYFHKTGIDNTDLFSI